MAGPAVGGRAGILHPAAVSLVFAGLSWPHESVATLVPNHALPIPVSAWHR